MHFPADGTQLCVPAVIHISFLRVARAISVVKYGRSARWHAVKAHGIASAAATLDCLRHLPAAVLASQTIPHSITLACRLPPSLTPPSPSCAHTASLCYRFDASLFFGFFAHQLSPQMPRRREKKEKFFIEPLEQAQICKCLHKGRGWVKCFQLLSTGG